MMSNSTMQPGPLLKKLKISNTRSSTPTVEIDEDEQNENKLIKELIEGFLRKHLAREVLNITESIIEESQLIITDLRATNATLIANDAYYKSEIARLEANDAYYKSEIAKLVANEAYNKSHIGHIVREKLDSVRTEEERQIIDDTKIAVDKLLKFSESRAIKTLININVN